MSSSWLDTPSHRSWLEQGLARVLTAALPSIRSEGGFAWLDAEGSPLPGRNPQLFLTARMAHTSAIGVRHGIPGSGELLDHAMRSLVELHADTEHGGWLSEPGVVTRKSTYDHVHVGLAAATALDVGHPAAAALLGQVVEVIESRLWDEETQTLRESFAADWSDSEDYRGANANMHGLEAFLAIGRATGDALWHVRGLAIAERLINHHARERDWLIPEHFTADWVVRPDYNEDEPEDPFRPFGATFGHSLEWARFLLDLDRSPLVGSPGWLAESAEALTRRALDGGWALDGRPGLVYTVGWDGVPVAVVRLHWPVCEGIQAAAALHRHTGDPHWEQWYRRLWDHAARYFIDERGTWRNELGPDMAEAGTVWPGRPDVYHCGGALAGPLHLDPRDAGVAAPAHRSTFFSGALIGTDDLRTEQEYHRDKARLHNRALHGSGVVHGLEVVCEGEGFRITPGFALDAFGREIVLTSEVHVDGAGVVDGVERHLVAAFGEVVSATVPGPDGPVDAGMVEQPVVSLVTGEDLAMDEVVLATIRWQGAGARVIDLGRRHTL